MDCDFSISEFNALQRDDKNNGVDPKAALRDLAERLAPLERATGHYPSEDWKRVLEQVEAAGLRAAPPTSTLYSKAAC